MLSLAATSAFGISVARVPTPLAPTRQIYPQTMLSFVFRWGKGHTKSTKLQIYFGLGVGNEWKSHICCFLGLKVNMFNVLAKEPKSISFSLIPTRVPGNPF